MFPMQQTVETVKVGGSKVDNLTVQVAMEMPFDIKTIESPSHPIKMKVSQIVV